MSGFCSVRDRLSLCLSNKIARLTQKKQSKVVIWCCTLSTRPLISGSSFVARHSSQSSCSTFHLSTTLCKEAARTVQQVGHNVRNPGAVGASCSFNFRNMASFFGEYFSRFEISEVVSKLSFKFLIPFTVSPTAAIAVSENCSWFFGLDLSGNPRL